MTGGFRGWTGRRRTVVDLGASRVVFAVFERARSGGLRLVECERVAHAPEGTGDAAGRTQMSAALAKVAGMRRERGRGGEIWLGMPAHLALTKWVTIPAIAGAKHARLVRFEAAQAIPYPLEEVAWDAEAVAGDGAERDVLLAAARTEAIDAVNQAATAVGWTPARATPAGVALHRGFRYNHPEVQGCSLLVNIGARSTLLLFVEPARYRGRTLVLGGEAATRAIAAELRIGFLDAEHLKCGAAEGAAEAAVRRAAEGLAVRLAVEIARSQASLGRRGGAVAPTRLYLSGGGAALAALPGALAEKLQLPVERYDPLRRVEVAPGVDAAAASETGAEAIGLGCIAWNPREVGGRGPNLLTREMIAARRFRRIRPVLLAAAAGVVLALGGAGYALDGQAVEAQRGVAVREAELRPFREAQMRLAGQKAERAALRQALSAARERAAARTAWRDFFRDLQTRLSEVEDGWIESLTAERERGREEDADNAGMLRLRLSGRLLDTGAAADERARRLLASVAASPFVAAVEEERFDRSQPGVLRVDFTLVAKRESAL